MATVQFEIREKKGQCTIYVRLSVARGCVYRRKTGRLIPKELWSVETNMPKGRTGESTNMK